MHALAFMGFIYDASLIVAFLLAINYFNSYSWISVNSFYSTPILNASSFAFYINILSAQ